MRHLLALPAICLAAACSQPIPDSGAGAASPGGYSSYEVERARREAALTGAPAAGLAGAAPATAAPVGATFPAVGLPATTLPATGTAPAAAAATPPGGISTSALAAAGIGAAPGGATAATLAPTAAVPSVAPAPLSAPAPGALVAGPAGGAAAPAFPGVAPAFPAAATPPGLAPDALRPTGVEASPANAAPALAGAATVPAANAGGISDEQNFDAVASRESIESDAARRAAQAAQYQVIQPEALPEPPASTGPNIVEYALAAPNGVGQEWYSRFAFAGTGRQQRNCAGYASPDEAQRDFLARGGPERDPRGLDPDGDGFACAWDPAPFRAAVGRG